MPQLKPLKNSIVSTIIIWLLTPATALAINPSYVHKSQSIGSIFRDIIFRYTFGIYAIFWSSIIFSIPAIILGYFIHRKYIAYLFFIIYPILFIIPIILNTDSKLSDILSGNIYLLYITVSATIIGFFASTLFNKIKKKKRKHSNKDYIPLAIIIAITLILMLIPIRSGHLVCKTPLLNDHFNCSYYLREAQMLNRSWFVF
ncbi:hypothetical protein GF354_06155 [Candidatus Peregrinibacteria bacterium]|nr:hypothetical protein [Candidatus Peregrinibacteria bacterium]